MFEKDEPMFQKVVFPTDLDMAVSYRVMLAAYWLSIHGLRAFRRIHPRSGRPVIAARSGKFVVRWFYSTRTYKLYYPANAPYPDEYDFTGLKELTQFLLEAET